jgi:hypothetical protein
VTPPHCSLLLAEGLAVGTLIHSRIGFVGAHHDLVQGAVILGITVISAGLNATFDALVGMAIHNYFPPF